MDWRRNTARLRGRHGMDIAQEEEQGRAIHATGPATPDKGRAMGRPTMESQTMGRKDTERKGTKEHTHDIKEKESITKEKERASAKETTTDHSRWNLERSNQEKH